MEKIDFQEKNLDRDIKIIIKYFQWFFNMDEYSKDLDEQKTIKLKSKSILKELLLILKRNRSLFWRAVFVLVEVFANYQWTNFDTNLKNFREYFFSKTHSISNVLNEDIKLEINRLFDAIETFNNYDEEILSWDFQQVIDKTHEIVKQKAKSEAYSGLLEGSFKIWDEVDIDKVDTVKEVDLNKFSFSSQFGKQIISTVTVPTGLSQLDNLIDGFTSSLIVLAGRSASGKTWFAINFMINVLKAGHYVLFFSLEMNYDSIAARFLANIMDEDFKKLLKLSKGDLEQRRKFDDFCDVNIKSPYINTGKLEIYNDVVKDLSNITTLIKSFKRKIKNKNKLLFVVIDHLREIDQSNTDLVEEQIWNFLGKVMRDLRSIVNNQRYSNICIMPLSQLSRNAVFRKSNQSFDLEDLAGSAFIEQVADVVIFIRRIKPSLLIGYEHNWLTEVNVAKNRFGMSDIFQVNFNTAKGTINDDSSVLDRLYSQKEKKDSNPGELFSDYI